HIPLVLGSPVVGGNVGPPKVHVHGLERTQHLRGHPRPERVGLVSLRALALGIESGHLNGFHAEREGDPSFNRHLDETSPSKAEPMLDGLQTRRMRSPVAREYQVGGKLPRPAPFDVDLRPFHHAMRTLHERVSEFGGSARSLRSVQRLARRYHWFELLESYAERSLLPIGRIRVADRAGERTAFGRMDN